MPLFGGWVDGWALVGGADGRAHACHTADAVPWARSRGEFVERYSVDKAYYSLPWIIQLSLLRMG